MKETRYFYVPDAATAGELPADEAVHAQRVLRLKAGDDIMLMDGEGAFYQAELTLTSPHHCQYRIKEALPQEPTWQGNIHLAIAPTKMADRMEWLVEKATEVGLDELSLLDCQFSERRQMKVVRLEKILVSAMKQSRKAWKPVINEMTSFDDFVKAHPDGRRYIAHCYEEVERVNLFDELRKPSESADAVVMIGPEGDFSIDEVRRAVAAGFVSVDLGKSRLRTETAGLAAVMMMHLAQQ
jgi:16S rRNA (uracil1498-N3)-methyltransferase